MKSWYAINAGEKNSVEIDIFDEIGIWGISAKRFASDLKNFANAKTINLRINSPGGDVIDGITIFNLLAQHPAQKTTTVYGLAGSISSYIAMIGSPVIMLEGTFMFVPNPLAGMLGYFYADELRKIADDIEKLGSSIVNTYQRKTKLEDSKLTQLLNEETLLTAQEAMSLGFADQIGPAVKLAAKFDLQRFESNAKLKDLIGAFKKDDPGGHAGPPLQDVRAQLKEMTDLCAAAGIGNDSALEYFNLGLTVDQVRTRLADAGSIRDACTAAFHGNAELAKPRAEKYIRSGMTIDEVRAELAMMKNRDDIPIDNKHGPDSGAAQPAKNKIDPKKIWDRFNRRKAPEDPKKKK